MSCVLIVFLNRRQLTVHLCSLQVFLYCLSSNDCLLVLFEGRIPLFNDFVQPLTKSGRSLSAKSITSSGSRYSSKTVLTNRLLAQSVFARDWPAGGDCCDALRDNLLDIYHELYLHLQGVSLAPQPCGPLLWLIWHRPTRIAKLELAA